MIRRQLEEVWNSLPELRLPKLGREVTIPVYLVHNSPDPEDYFFIFDFEEFVEASRSGIFVRPRLKVWAGRTDFSRRIFARQYREAFAREFEAAQVALARVDGKKGGSGWLDFDITGGVAGFAAKVMANVVLYLATHAGKAILSATPLAGLVRARSDKAKLEAEIAKTREAVDDALAKMEVRLHIELYRHAWRGTAPGPIADMDRDAWPLPDFVRRHLGDG